MNSVNFIGRLGRDPEIKHNQKGTAICTFSLAVERYNRDEPDWFEIVCFDKIADTAAEYLDKGSLVALECRAQQDTWETDDGHKRSMVKFVAHRVQFLESRAEAERRRGGQERPARAPAAENPFGDDDGYNPFGDA